MGRDGTIPAHVSVITSQHLGHFSEAFVSFHSSPLFSGHGWLSVLMNATNDTCIALDGVLLVSPSIFSSTIV